MEKDMRAQQMAQKVEQLRLMEQQRVENLAIMNELKKNHQKTMKKLREDARAYQKTEEKLRTQKHELGIEMLQLEGHLMDRIGEMEIADAEGKDELRAEIERLKAEHASENAERNEVGEFLAKTMESLKNLFPMGKTISA